MSNIRNKFESDVIQILKNNNFKIVEENPKYIDILVEKDGKRIAIEIKNENDPILFLPNAFGQLMASKYVYETDQEWLVINCKLQRSDYLRIMVENNIKFFTIEGNKLIEINDFLPNKRNRRVKTGFDADKIARIWKVLSERQDWMYINEISRETNINKVTVRWYLDHYFQKFIDERKLSESIRVRFVKLKDNINLEGMLAAIRIIKSVRHGEYPVQETDEKHIEI